MDKSVATGSQGLLGADPTRAAQVQHHVIKPPRLVDVLVANAPGINIRPSLKQRNRAAVATRYSGQARTKAENPATLGQRHCPFSVAVQAPLERSRNLDGI